VTPVVETAPAPVVDASSTASGGRAALAFWGLLVLAFVVPVAGLVVLLTAVPDRVESLSPPVEPAVVPVNLVEVDGAQPVTAELTWAEGAVVSAPAWSGLVTAVLVAPGDEVSTGTVLARVDGVDRVAVASRSPFHRALAAGDRGPDVAMLRSALADLGHPAGASAGGSAGEDYFDGQLAAAVRRLEADLAHTGPDAASGVFRPEWFGWLPVRTLTAHEVTLRAGRPAPAAGEPVLAGSPSLATLAVTLDETVRVEQASYAFVYGEAAVPLTEQFSAAGESLEPLAAAVPADAEAVEGQLRLVTSRQAMVVPITAVLTDADGGHCVLRVVAGGYQPAPVRVDGGGIGTAEIGSGLQPGDQILANPSEVGEACG
jgi:multidrug efflux pump subunit AcrA (membrane-fusion protein)